MKKVEIFEPAMCCSTGVCGPSINPELMRIATIIKSLKDKGIIIKRHGLSSEPLDFISNKVINKIITEQGAEVLPVTLVDGEIVRTKSYPTNEELSEWLGVEIKQSKRKHGHGPGSKGAY